MQRLLRAIAPATVFLALCAPIAAAQDTGSIIIGDPGQSAHQGQSTTQNNAQGVGDDNSIQVGSPGQKSDQQAQTNQQIDQAQNGTFIVFNGGLHQVANQDASTLQDNNQQSAGGVNVGSPGQSNLQHATTNQRISQEMTGTFVVFGGTRQVNPNLVASLDRLNACAICAEGLLGAPVLVGGNLRQNGGDRQSQAGTFVVFGNLEQRASQESSITEVNRQISSGSIIIGSPGQVNEQRASTDQVIEQSLDGIFIVFGTLDQLADQSASTVQINDQEHVG